jgi:hypothetical protein
MAIDLAASLSSVDVDDMRLHLEAIAAAACGCPEALLRRSMDLPETQYSRTHVVVSSGAGRRISCRLTFPLHNRHHHAPQVRICLTPL